MLSQPLAHYLLDTYYMYTYMYATFFVDLYFQLFLACGISVLIFHDLNILFLSKFISHLGEKVFYLKVTFPTFFCQSVANLLIENLILTIYPEVTTIHRCRKIFVIDLPLNVVLRFKSFKISVLHCITCCN